MPDWTFTVEPAGPGQVRLCMNYVGGQELADGRAMVKALRKLRRCLADVLKEAEDEMKKEKT